MFDENLLRAKAWEAASHVALRECSKVVKREARRQSNKQTNEKTGSEHQKITANYRKPDIPG